MYINNFTLTRPPEEALDECHCVFISDPVVPMWQMKKWCLEHNLSLIWYELVETADVGGSEFDAVAGFYFIDPVDATLFTLKFK
jgi:hypothetical protein